jgi:hypothetical protein
VVIDDEESRRQHLNHKVARSRIKAAIYEFYRSMEMLKNYKVIIAYIRWRLVCHVRDIISDHLFVILLGVEQDRIHKDYEEV